MFDKNFAIAFILKREFLITNVLIEKKMPWRHYSRTLDILSYGVYFYWHIRGKANVGRFFNAVLGVVHYIPFLILFKTI